MTADPGGERKEERRPAAERVPRWYRRSKGMTALDRTISHVRIKPTSQIVWLSFCSACLALMFDAMDLTIFTLILFPSVSELIGSTDPALVAYTGGIILAFKLVAWGLGGIAFGV